MRLAARRTGLRAGILSPTVRRVNIASIEASFGAERASPCSIDFRVCHSRPLMLIITTLSSAKPAAYPRLPNAYQQLTNL
jgi:hypothetical protein